MLHQPNVMPHALHKLFPLICSQNILKLVYSWMKFIKRLPKGLLPHLQLYSEKQLLSSLLLRKLIFKPWHHMVAEILRRNLGKMEWRFHLSMWTPLGDNFIKLHMIVSWGSTSSWCWEVCFQIQFKRHFIAVAKYVGLIGQIRCRDAEDINLPPDNIHDFN